MTIDSHEVWSLNDAGLAQRTISGVLAISFEGIADAYRNHVVPILPYGFNRREQTYAMSKDMKTLKFSITDMEIPRR